MSLKERAHVRKTENLKPRSTVSAVESQPLSARRQPHPATVHRLAGMYGIDLTPREVLQLQRTVGNRATAQLLIRTALRRLPRDKNSTGLPDNLKTGVESLSGVALDDIRVHYNSPKPAELHALA